MKWNTAISTIQQDEAIVRGKKLTELAKEASFAGSTYFILTGKQASKSIDKLMNVMLSVSIDHGLGVVSTQSARISASAGTSIQQSLIAALASMGKLHGGATENSALWLQSKLNSKISAQDAVKKALSIKERIPGYGHSILKNDERVDLLINEAESLGLVREYTKFAQEVEKEIENQKGKKIPLNIDGVIASLALDIGISPNAVTGLFIIGRMPGLVAHIQEEREQKNGIHRIPEEDVEYTG